MNHGEVLELPFLLEKRRSAVSVNDGRMGNSSGSSGANFLDFKVTHINPAIGPIGDMTTA